MKVTNEMLMKSSQYKYLSKAVIRFLHCHDKFLDERTIEANKACNSAVERLRNLVDEHLSY